MFWGFAFRLWIGALISPFVFSFMVVPLFYLTAFTMRGRADGAPRPTPLTYPMMVLTGGAQVYFWGLWAAYCASLAVSRTAHPEVTHKWLYYAVAVQSLITPLTKREVDRITSGTLFYNAVALGAFLVFVLWPGLMRAPYGWANALLAPVQVAESDQRTHTAASSDASGSPVEYTDNVYNFGFQFPSDWKLQKVPPPGEVGEVRAFVVSPRKGRSVMALVGSFGRTLTKEQFERSPNRETAVNGLIDLTVEQIHRKTSRDIGASRMLVSEKRALPSDVGIKFYISTAHFMDKVVMGVASIHVIPFGKDYVVNFVMISPLDPKATAENEIMTKVFNSFHIVGERPN